MDILITRYPRWGTADVKAMSDKGLAWLRTFTVLPVHDDRRYITISNDGVGEYVDAARAEGLRVED